MTVPLFWRHSERMRGIFLHGGIQTKLKLHRYSVKNFSRQMPTMISSATDSSLPTMDVRQLISTMREFRNRLLSLVADLDDWVCLLCARAQPIAHTPVYTSTSIDDLIERVRRELPPRRGAPRRSLNASAIKRRKGATG